MMVKVKSSDQLLQAWLDGLSLSDALELFEPEFDAAELTRKADEQRRISEIGKRNFRKFAGISDLDPLLDAIGDGLASLSKATLSRQSRAHQLIDALEKRDLVALGFPTDRPQAATPEPVPNFLIRLPLANFRKSEFSDGEHRYSKVRIVNVAALPTPEIGRPSVRKAIFELASALANKGTISPDMPPKVQAGKIRKYGNFSEITPSDQTIQRHLKSFWNSN
jgi:hypothetical protein